MPLEEYQSKVGKKMVKINLLPERPEAAIWRRMERVLWILWFSLPLAIILWAKLTVNAR